MSETEQPLFGVKESYILTVVQSLLVHPIQVQETPMPQIQYQQ